MYQDSGGLPVLADALSLHTETILKVVSGAWDENTDQMKSVLETVAVMWLLIRCAHHHGNSYSEVVHTLQVFFSFFIFRMQN